MWMRVQSERRRRRSKNKTHAHDQNHNSNDYHNNNNNDCNSNSSSSNHHINRPIEKRSVLMVLFVLRSYLLNRTINKRMKQRKKGATTTTTAHRVIHQSNISTDTPLHLCSRIYSVISWKSRLCMLVYLECKRLFSFIFFLFFIIFCFIIPLLRLIVINALDFEHFLSCLVDITTAVAVDTLIVLAVIVIGVQPLPQSMMFIFISSSQALMLTLLSSCCLLFSFAWVCVFIHSEHVSTHVVLWSSTKQNWINRTRWRRSSSSSRRKYDY